MAGAGQGDPSRAALRAALLARRRALAEADVLAASAHLAEAVRGSRAWRDADTIAAFVGVRNEPHTAALLEAALAEGKALWLPAMRGGVIAFARVRSLDALAPAPFGLVEPVAAPGEVTLGELAPPLVLVPGLAFSSAGARIGFGRGHYDRALAPLRTRDDCVRMGVAFAAFVDPPEGAIPMAAHDVPMHQLATEHGVVDCRAPQPR